MTDLDHERTRLISLVDRFLYEMRESPDPLTDARIEEAVICCAIGGMDPDGDQAEEIKSTSESLSTFKRVGVLHGAIMIENRRYQ